MVKKITVVFIILLSAHSVFSAGFRSIDRIATPAKSSYSTTTEQKSVVTNLAIAKNIARSRLNEVTRNAVNKIAEAWNTPDLEQMVSNDFYDRTRLFDAFAKDVPRDAKLRILAIEGVNVFENNVFVLTDTSELVFHNKVSVNVRTQVEYNDPANGFQRQEGVNDMILNIRQVFKLEDLP